MVYFTAIDSVLGGVFLGHLPLPSTDHSTDSVLGGVFTAIFHYLLLITLRILSYVVYFIATYPYLLLTILLILFLVVYFTAIDSGLGDVFHGHLSLPSDQSTDSVLGGVFHGPFPLPTADHLTDSVIIMWCISSSPFPTFY